MRFDWWPLMLKRTHEAVRRENFELRGALHHRNKEVREHRLLLGSLREGHTETTEALERVLAKPR